MGDGGIYFYVQDVIVHPDHQGKGVGRSIMNAIMHYLRSMAEEGSYIGLMAAKNVEGFYELYGFRRRPGNRPGMYMLIERDGT